MLQRLHPHMLNLNAGCEQGHAMRAAINTPIQGSAADVATAAMLSIAACPELRALGWTMLLQARGLPLGHECVGF